MKTFRYRALSNRTGMLETGEIQSDSAATAADAIARDGRKPFEIVEKGRFGLMPSSTSIFASSDKPDMVQVFADLDVLLSAGFTIDAALSAAAAGIQNRGKRALVEKTVRLLEGGAKLRDAFALIPDLRQDILALIESGENSGKLPATISMIASMLSADRKRQSALIEALVYPSFLIVAMLAAVGVITFFLVPALDPIFENAPSARPTMLIILGAVRNVLEGDQLALMAGLVFFCGAGYLFWRNQSVAALRALAILHLPIVGAIVKARAMSRYLGILGVLLGSGVNMRSALTLAKDACPIHYYHSRLTTVRDVVVKGGSFRDAARGTGLFKDSSLALISIGDEANRLPEALGRASALLEAEASRSLDRLLAILTPVITMAMGLMIGSLVISVMSAILSVNDLANQ